MGGGGGEGEDQVVSTNTFQYIIFFPTSQFPNPWGGGSGSLSQFFFDFYSSGERTSLFEYFFSYPQEVSF